jgi:hypothetical protein
MDVMCDCAQSGVDMNCVRNASRTIAKEHVIEIQIWRRRQCCWDLNVLL